MNLNHCFSEHAEKYGYGVVERFVGHGVGTVFHSEPLILHNRKSSLRTNIVLSSIKYSTILVSDVLREGGIILSLP